MKFWIVTFNEGDFLISLKRNFDILGLPDQTRWANLLKQVSEGDKIISYASGISRFGAVLEVTREYYHEATKIWEREDELWPHRIDTQPLYVLPENINVDAEEVVRGMETPSEKQKSHGNWALFLRGSMREISKKDYNWIIRKMGEAANDDISALLIDSASATAPGAVLGRVKAEVEAEDAERDLLPEIKKEDRESLIKDLVDLTPDEPIEVVYRGKTYRRDHKTITQIKYLRGYHCQICGFSITKPDGTKYIEAAHIKPKKHRGPELPNNIMILCPNHHKEFDHGGPEILEHTETLIRYKVGSNEYTIDLSLE